MSIVGASAKVPTAQPIRRPRRAHRSSESLKVRHYAEVVARPHSIDRLVKNDGTAMDLERRARVFTAAHEDVVDAPERRARGHSPNDPTGRCRPGDRCAP
jgi:hypothetical protein